MGTLVSRAFLHPEGLQRRWRLPARPRAVSTGFPAPSGKPGTGHDPPEARLGLPGPTAARPRSAPVTETGAKPTRRGRV